MKTTALKKFTLAAGLAASVITGIAAGASAEELQDVDYPVIEMQGRAGTSAVAAERAVPGNIAANRISWTRARCSGGELDADATFNQFHGGHYAARFLTYNSDGSFREDTPFRQYDRRFDGSRSPKVRVKTGDFSEFDQLQCNSSMTVVVEYQEKVGTRWMVVGRERKEL